MGSTSRSLDAVRSVQERATPSQHPVGEVCERKGKVNDGVDYRNQCAWLLASFTKMCVDVKRRLADEFINSRFLDLSLWIRVDDFVRSLGMTGQHGETTHPLISVATNTVKNISLLVNESGKTDAGIVWLSKPAPYIIDSYLVSIAGLLPSASRRISGAVTVPRRRILERYGYIQSHELGSLNPGLAPRSLSQALCHHVSVQTSQPIDTGISRLNLTLR